MVPPGLAVGSQVVISPELTPLIPSETLHRTSILCSEYVFAKGFLVPTQPCLAALRSYQIACVAAATAHSSPLSAHFTLSPRRARERGGRLTLQHYHQHFFHCAQLVLCQALVLSGIVHLQVGIGGGMQRSGEENEGEESSSGQLDRRAAGARPNSQEALRT